MVMKSYCDLCGQEVPEDIIVKSRGKTIKFTWVVKINGKYVDVCLDCLKKRGVI